MAASSSNEQSKAGPAEQVATEMVNNKKEKKEIKSRFRHLTDEMLEEYHRMSIEAELFKRQYEEAAFKVYGTLPARKISFKKNITSVKLTQP